MIKHYLLTILFVIPAFLLVANNTPSDRSDYIHSYKEKAILEMFYSGIPASITMAQAIYESGNGKSDLAINSNNHFGIKCKSDWIGQKYLHIDDDKDEDGNLIHSCFRVYESVDHSFRDHSNFLLNKERYAVLFTYGLDYKKWAKGLKICGYATKVDYAETIIRIIEENNLQVLDEVTSIPGTIKQSSDGNTQAKRNSADEYSVVWNNKIAALFQK